MKNGRTHSGRNRGEITEKVKRPRLECIVSEKEAECLGQRFVVSNMKAMVKISN